MAGDAYCDDCYGDLKDPFDRDLSMYCKERRQSGVCQCCGHAVG